jgi:pimeloyl-ACP methyl ester carboxylesterase
MRCLRNFLWSVTCLILACSVRAEDGSFDSNGVKINFRILGQGEPVVLIHGFTGNLETWNALANSLAKTHYVVSLDCRGHGKSGKPHDPKLYGTEMAEDVIRLMDHLRIPKAHVMGYSMGAMITAKLLATHPDRILSATLGGAAGLRATDEPIKLSVPTAEALEKGEGIKPIIVYLTPPGRPVPTDEQIKQINAFLTASNDTKALAAVMRGFSGLTVTEAQMKANKVPTQAIIGTADPLIKIVDYWTGKMGSLVTVTRIEGADHGTASGNPAFNLAIDRWLNLTVKQPDRPASRALVKLFDGTSFAGWEGDTKTTFRVVDGAIVGGSLTETVPTNMFLCTTRTYSDFVLRLKFKLVGTGFVNAGVQVRSRRIQDPPNEMSGYQADMGEGYWGAIYDESRRNKVLAKPDDETMKRALKPGEWNDYEIRCQGPRIVLKLNGIQTVDYTETDPSIPLQGIIGLQVHGGGKSEASYRDITIEELPRSK